MGCILGRLVPSRVHGLTIMRDNVLDECNDLTDAQTQTWRRPADRAVNLQLERRCSRNLDVDQHWIHWYRTRFSG